MPLAGFEPAVPASERPQAYALDRAATGISTGKYVLCFPGVTTHRGCIFTAR